MKLSKQKIKNIFILIIGVFVIIPIVLILFNMNPSTPSYEPFFDKASGNSTGTSSGRQHSITSKDVLANYQPNMDRVDISGVKIMYGDNLDMSYVGLSNEYIYCLGGKLQCPSGSYLVDEVSYNLPGTTSSFAHTYNFKCTDASSGESVSLSDTSFVTCDNYLSKTDVNQLYLQGEYKDGNNENYTFYEITNSTITPEDNDTRTQNSRGIGLVGATGLDGFTNPFNYVPLSINGEYVYLYKPDMTKRFDTNTCYLMNSDLCCNNISGGDDDDDGKCGTGEGEINCLANNGAEKGDALCCGQSGVVQNTKYNCPASFPVCKGYKCGSTWGKCHTK